MKLQISPTCRFLVLAALGAGMLTAKAPAQTVRPVIVEYRGPAKGKFELVNNGLQPASVVIEPRSFTIEEDGDGVYGPLLKDIHIKLSAMSLQIPAKQSRFVFYEANADALPAWFVIYSVFAGPTQQSGLAVHLALPHTVYLVQKEALEKQDVTVESLKYLPEQHKAIVMIANNSDRLGRALEWQVSTRQATSTSNGFPLLPHSRRKLEVAWTGPNPPDTFLIRFEHFSFKEDFSASHE
jgi:hypothetical protein